MLSLTTQCVEKGHEQVAFFQDPGSQTFAIVALHSTVLGPALGGCRMQLYASLEEALFDVLRLSEGMTYKNSLAGLNLGGGKAVLVADRAMKKGRTELFETFGRFVATLGGRYYTAEDMGTSVSDMSSVLRTCPFVAGRDPAVGGGGDPSPYTALGVFHGMRACLERAYGSPDFRGRRISVQGVGNVGSHLVKLLHDAGAVLTLSDKLPDVLAAACAKFGIQKTAGPEEIISTDCDVFAPCAAGGVLNAETVNKLKARVVAGAANNQILGQGIDKQLQARGILYAPDFAINAGGVILCADELEPGGFTEARVLERVGRIHDTIQKIFIEAERTGHSSTEVAVRLAKERIRRSADGKKGSSK